MPAPTQEHLLTVREAAEILRVTPETVRRRVRAGDLSACRLGRGAIRIRRADLDAAPAAVPPDTDLVAYVAKVISEAPPLTPQQCRTIAGLLRPSGGAAA